jgi:hypothetical protein
MTLITLTTCLNNNIIISNNKIKIKNLTNFRAVLFSVAFENILLLTSFKLL